MGIDSFSFSGCSFSVFYFGLVRLFIRLSLMFFCGCNWKVMWLGVVLLWFGCLNS